ncbi:hypothetical protein [Beijerinckia sp. L45]|uniref:hypothetical protein n=1 Tax=Beijerinckia sp. L45 TaxID=1641855 RepID=UPI00131BA597|nr:hypothetical protein [Beijerinckia sp. L45]
MSDHTPYTQPSITFRFREVGLAATGRFAIIVAAIVVVILIGGDHQTDHFGERYAPEAKSKYWCNEPPPQACAKKLSSLHSTESMSEACLNDTQ